MKSIILSCLLVFACLSAYAQDADEKAMTRDQAFSTITSTAGSLMTGLKAGEVGPEELKEILFDFSEGFYLQGFITLEQRNGKRAEAELCVTSEMNRRNPPPLDPLNLPPIPECRPKDEYGNDYLPDANYGINSFLCQMRYKQWLTTKRDQDCGQAVNFNTLKATPPACIKAGQVASGGECCPGLIYAPSASIESKLSGKKVNEACSDHGDCASKQCFKEEGASVGLCTNAFTCFASAPLGGECSGESPFCQSGVCRVQDLGLAGVTCKADAQMCSSNTECCSGKCNGGKCVERMVCENCVPEGQKPNAKQVCCKGMIEDVDGICTLEMPPFILPSNKSTRVKKSLWHHVALAVLPWSYAVAAEITPVETSKIDANQARLEEAKSKSANTSQGTWVNDDALTLAQIEMIEGEIKVILKIKDKAQRAAKLKAVYAKRKDIAAQNASAKKAGKNIGETFTQEDYVKRYNIPAITPKQRSNVEACEFSTARDNWLDSSNLMRNADLFMRGFEVSMSGQGTQDLWHLLNKSGTPHKENIYTRSKKIMDEFRFNRNAQHEQMAYLDMVMACQCIYSFGPEKFSADKQAFFYSKCTGGSQNKICRDGQMQESLRLKDSPEPEYQAGLEFPNYVEMYLRKLEKMADQVRKDEGDVDNIDSGAAGINHEEILVRWLRMRSCNQVDVFIDTEKIEGQVQELAEDLNRAKKVDPKLKAYWDNRLAQMAGGGVQGPIVNLFRQDQTKDIRFRGYVHTESKVHQWKLKKLKFLFAIIMAVLSLGAAMVGLVSMTYALLSAAKDLIVGLIMASGDPTGGYSVVQSFAKDFPNVIIEDRLVEKKSCGFLKLFNCKTFYRILHWPASSNKPGIEAVFPWRKKESRSCRDTYSAAIGYGGVEPNPCVGPFKATMCAASFYRPTADKAIADNPDFQSWKKVMFDRMLMDPAMPEFMEAEVNLKNNWVPELNKGFQEGCKWAQSIGKRKPTATDKKRFFPNFMLYMTSEGEFKPEYTFEQGRIDAYKKAVVKYALCDNLNECGQTNYDGKHPNPRGFADIFNVQEGLLTEKGVDAKKDSQARAELFADYVYQMHYQWRFMSSKVGLGYPLAYLENYYLSLLHNVRLLTTLSIRRGIEMDDAYNRYAEDLAIRRSRYQFTGAKYGVEMGDDGRERGATTQSSLFRSFRSLGFPLSAEFAGLPASASANATSSSSASGATLNDFNETALAAARRTASRVAKDNMAWKNFKDRTKGNPESAERLRRASDFAGRLNSPLSAVPSMAKPGDNSAYSGVGGSMGTLTNRGGSGELTDAARAEESQKITAISGSAPGSSSGVGSSSQGSGSSNGFGDADFGSLGTGSLDLGAAGGSGVTDGQGNSLTDAARMTGMKEGDVKNMLESAKRNRDGLSSSEDDSLFQKVSKAYLRNLDRVLVRKKGASVPAKKEATKGEASDKEKEDLKKIFNQ